MCVAIFSIFRTSLVALNAASCRCTKRSSSRPPSLSSLSAECGVRRLPGAYGIPNGLWPCALSDGIGNTLVRHISYILDHNCKPLSQLSFTSTPQVLPSARNPKAVEDILRTVTTQMGSKSGVSMAPLSRKTCTEYGVPHTVSQAWRIGRAIALCRKKNVLKDIQRAILELQNGACLFIGKIVDVQRASLRILLHQSIRRPEE